MTSLPLMVNPVRIGGWPKYRIRHLACQPSHTIHSPDCLTFARLYQQSGECMTWLGWQPKCCIRFFNRPTTTVAYISNRKKPRPGKRVAATTLSEFYQCDPGMWATVGVSAIVRHRGCHSRRLLVFINSRRGRRAFDVNFRTLQSNSRRIGISDRWHSCAYI